MEGPKSVRSAFEYEPHKQSLPNRQYEKHRLLQEDRGAQCQNDSDSDAHVELVDQSLADASIDNTVRDSVRRQRKLGKADLMKIRTTVEKVSKRAVAEIKFCNGIDEESDVVFDWCSQVVQTVLTNLPPRHAKLILKDSQEELDL